MENPLSEKLIEHCDKIRSERPVPYSLTLVVMGKLDIVTIGAYRKHDIDVEEILQHRFEKGYSEAEWKEYLVTCNLMRNELAESQVKARNRKHRGKAQRY